MTIPTASAVTLTHIEIGLGVITSARINSLGVYFDISEWATEFTQVVVYAVNSEGEAFGVSVHDDYEDAVAEANRARAEYRIEAPVRDRILEGY